MLIIIFTTIFLVSVAGIPEKNEWNSQEDQARLNEFINIDGSGDMVIAPEYSSSGVPKRRLRPQMNIIDEFINDNNHRAVDFPEPDYQSLQPPEKKFKLNRFANFGDDSTLYNDQNCAETENEYFRNKVKPHVHRFVNMFLRYSKLANRQIEKSKVMYATLHIAVPSNTVKELQDFFNGKKPDVSFEELDQYLSDIFYTSRLGEVDDFFRWSSQRVSSLWHPIKVKVDETGSQISNALPTFSIFQLLYLILILVFLWNLWRAHRHSASLDLPNLAGSTPLRRTPDDSYWRTCTIFVLSLTFVDVLKEYYRRVKEEEIRVYMRMAKRAANRPDCDPSKQKFYAPIVNLIYGDPCIEMYRDEVIDTSTHISFVECFLDTHIATLVELPFNALSRITASMSKTMSGWGWFSALLAPYMNIVLYLLLLVGALFATGIIKRLKFSFWPFATFEVGGDDGRRRDNSAPIAASSRAATESLPASNITIINNNYPNQTSTPRRRHTSGSIRSDPSKKMLRNASTPAIAASSSSAQSNELMPPLPEAQQSSPIHECFQNVSNYAKDLLQSSLAKTSNFMQNVPEPDDSDSDYSVISETEAKDEKLSRPDSSEIDTDENSALSTNERRSSENMKKSPLKPLNNCGLSNAVSTDSSQNVIRNDDNDEPSHQFEKSNMSTKEDYLHVLDEAKRNLTMDEFHQLLDDAKAKLVYDNELRLKDVENKVLNRVESTSLKPHDVTSDVSFKNASIERSFVDSNLCDISAIQSESECKHFREVDGSILVPGSSCAPDESTNAEVHGSVGSSNSDLDISAPVEKIRENMRFLLEEFD